MTLADVVLCCCRLNEDGTVEMRIFLSTDKYMGTWMVKGDTVNMAEQNETLDFAFEDDSLRNNLLLLNFIRQEGSLWILLLG